MLILVLEFVLRILSFTRHLRSFVINFIRVLLSLLDSLVRIRILTGILKFRRRYLIVPGGKYRLLLSRRGVYGV